LLLLIDTRSVASPEDLGALIRRIRSDPTWAAAVACVAHTPDIRFRLAALRAGVHAYLPASAGPEEIASRLAILTGAERKAPYRVLVVDDQPVAALFAARVLEGSGMVTEQVGDPLRVLDALERFVPDMVLMDLHMPGANGIELTGIIREQDRFADLPIVFLSCELDAHRQVEALRIVGDEFREKPVAPERLISCVRRRLRLVEDRARRRSGVLATDPLTGLVTRERLLVRLDRLIGQPQAGAASGAQAALIYLDQEGDEAALVHLASEVTKRVRGSDVVARVGERAVAVLVRRGGEADLAGFAETLGRELHRDLPSLGAGAPPSAVGVGWCPLSASGGDSVTLVSRARMAAHVALRHAGGCAEAYERATGRRLAADDKTRVIEAIAAERYKLLFQPMVALRNASADRYEATVRLRALDGELIGPPGFARIASESGEAERIDRWLLLAGLDSLRQRLDSQNPVQLHVHQSFASVATNGWIRWLQHQIGMRDLAGLPPVIQFQVSESEQNLDLAVRRARNLERLGIPLCLNGLDAGERSARVLAAVPAAFVRLSRQSVQGLEDGVIGELVERAHERGALVIATGVEGPDGIARVHRFGVDLIQGLYVQPPTEGMDFDFTGTESSDHGPPIG